ncbi:probable phosphoglycerate mutase [Candidatus Planktophila versatilis]|uniref:Probable phosphoglycerate mutase n=1 Tax=Candidatus Planktophila versatilis TaxID=1884905 RepID=A0AAD0E702_9ACTN|nr:histidine phosphatase family protein [Candidatus Planktophila versatilis]ASY22586.1 probable phosphoglycerate mutase [Candidatus Planktophila versatilis]
MARIILLRHAHSIANESGILAGQLPGISLSKKGSQQAIDLVDRIGKVSFDSIRMSPMQRCQETLAPWLESAHSNGLKRFILDEKLIEMNYGSWSGKKLNSLAKQPLWKIIQKTPSKVEFPQGERMTAMQKRAVASVEEAVLEKSKGTHLFVSHGDVIKAMVASLLKMKLDNFQSLVIDPASITMLEYDGDSARLILFNDNITHLEGSLSGARPKKMLLGGGAGAVRRKKK